MVITMVIIIILVGLAIASFVVTRHIRLIEYTSLRGQATFHHLLFTVLSSLVGGWMFLGLSAVGYEAGIVGYVIGVAYAVGLLILGFFIPRIKSLMTSENCDTMDEYIGARYGPIAQAAASLLNLSVFLAILAAQFIAMTAFLSVFVSFGGDWLFYVAVASVLFYTTYAGFKGVLLTDVWQFWVLSVSVLLITFLLIFNVDVQSVTALPSRYFNGTGYGLSFLIGIVLFLPISLLVRTDLWQRTASAKSTKDIQRALYWAAPILLIFYILLTTVGILARATLGEGVRADTSGLIVFLNILRGSGMGEFSFLGNIIIIVFSLGVLAALLSTIDTNLNVVSVAISKVLRRQDWRRFEKDTVDKIGGSRTPLESSLLQTSRIVTVVLGLLSLIVAHLVPNIVDLIVGAASILIVFVPTIAGSLFWKLEKTLPVTVSISAGYLAFLITALSISNPKVAFIPGIIVSFASFALLHLLSNFLRRRRR